MKLFNRTFTAEVIHKEVTKLAKKYAKQCKTPASNDAMVEKNKKLLELGLTSSSTFLTTQQAVDTKNRELCFRFFNENFPGCCIIRDSDFFNLLRKYNLCCGKLDQYTGTIPDENLEEVYEARNALQDMDVMVHNQFSNINASGDPTQIILNVFIKENRWKDDKHQELYSAQKTLYESVNRFPFYDCIDFGVLNQSFSGLTFNFDRVSCKKTELFIAGPIQEFKQLVNIEVKEARKAEDPFVFQRTPYGIVILSKWGAEADDEIFK